MPEGMPMVSAGGGSAQAMGELAKATATDEALQTQKPKQIVQAPVPIESSYFSRVPVSTRQ